MAGKLLPLFIGLAVCALGVKTQNNVITYRNGGLPINVDGREFFTDFMKCDNSLHYCFEFKNDSCVGPGNWVCVHSLNREAGLEGADTDIDIKNDGLGNTRCCGGAYQSPIDLPPDAPCLGTITPYYTDPLQPLAGLLENTGYYAKFLVNDEENGHPLILRGVPFTETIYRLEDYVFANIHIHTGKDGHGSEHLVGGRAYDGEMHMVHVHKTFWSAGEIDMRCASQTPLGIAVIGIFLSLDQGDPNAELDRLLHHDNMEKIVVPHEDCKCDYDKICDPDLDDDDDDDDCDDDDDNGEGSRGRVKRDISNEVICFCRRRSYKDVMIADAGLGEELECLALYNEGSKMRDEKPHVCNHHTNKGRNNGDDNVVPITLMPGLLLPYNREYYQYFGSLTTPPCSEVVNWIVMKEPIRITQQQLEDLRQLESRREDDVIGKYGNVRPTQSRNGRTVLSGYC